MAAMENKGQISEKVSSIQEKTESIKSNVPEYEVVHLDHGVERAAQGSSFLAYFNVVCVVAGTGALQLPYALRQGGWIGLFILGLSWILSTYSSIVLIKSLYHNGRTRLTSYQEVAEAAFGPIGGWIAFFFTAVTLIGVPVLYVLLAGQNLHAVCKGTSAELTFEIWTIICAALVAVPFVFFKSLKEVGFTSIFGVLTTLVCVLIVLGVSVRDLNENNITANHDSVIWSQFPIALSSIAFSFGGNPVYPHVEAGMRNPKDWNKVVFAGLSTCVAFYFLTAVPGYYIYGTNAASPIYNSLPEGAPKMASIIIITAHVLLAMPVLMTSFALDLEKMFRISTFHQSRMVEFLLRAALRIIMIVVVTVIAIYVPYFGSFMSLLGAFSNCTLIFIFPVIFYYRLTGIRNKPFYELILGAIAVLLGIVGLIFGSKSAIEELIDNFQKDN